MPDSSFSSLAQENYEARIAEDAERMETFLSVMEMANTPAAFAGSGPECNIPIDYFLPGQQKLAALEAVHKAHTSFLTIGTLLTEAYLLDPKNNPAPETSLQYRAAEERLKKTREHLSNLTSS